MLKFNYVTPFLRDAFLLSIIIWGLFEHSLLYETRDSNRLPILLHAGMFLRHKLGDPCIVGAGEVRDAGELCFVKPPVAVVRWGDLIRWAAQVRWA